MKCKNKAKAKGKASLLYPELENAYGEEAAYSLYRKVKAAKKAGRFGSRAMRPNGEPTLKQVQELLKNGELDPLTSAQVNDAELARITDLVARSLATVSTRYERYKDPKAAGSPLAISDKVRAELYRLKDRLTKLDALSAYVELVKYADRQLRTYSEFLRDDFDAQAAADSDGANQHGAALEEISTQLAFYDDILSPELAKDYSTLRDVLVGSGGQKGLNRQKLDLEAAVLQAREDLLTAISQRLNNSEGLTEAQSRADIRGGKDVSWATKAFGGATQSSSKLLSLVAAVVDFAKQRGRDLGMALKKTVHAADQALKKAGVKDFGWMLGLDADGKADGTFLQKIGRGYDAQLRKLEAAVSIAGDYYTGTGLSQAQITHNVKLYEAKTQLRQFLNAETLSDQGVPSDGEHHRYTQEFKDERARFEEPRQDGKYWYWTRKAGNFGYASADLAQEKYEHYQAKYYGEERPVKVMQKVNGLPTGEVSERMMRFTNQKSTTEIVEERHRDPRYAALLADQSAAGRAKVAYYNFFTEQLDRFVRTQPQNDVRHLLRGELPAVMATVLSGYNSATPGMLDYAGRVVTNPLMALRELFPAAVAGRDSLSIRLAEDGTRLEDVENKYTGRFRNADTIAKLQQELKQLQAAQAKAADPDFTKKERRLKEDLTTEQNRPLPSAVETDLSKLLYAYGAMALNYEQLKQQQGTVNLIRDAVRNRKFYEEKNGEILLNAKGEPTPKKNYSSQLGLQLEDWVKQNYLHDTGLGHDAVEAWGRRFKQYVSITFQGGNYAAALKNLVAGNLANRIAAAGRQFGWDKKVANWALKEISLQGTLVIADNLAEHLSGGGLVLHPKRSKVDALMSEHGFMEHESHLTGSGLFAKLAFIGVTVGEYHIQSQLALSKLKVTMLTGLDGKQQNAYDAMSLVNGELHVDPNYAADWEKIRHRTILVVRNIIKHTQGNHSDQDKVAMEKDWLSASLLQFHRWVYNGFKGRFGRVQYDEGLRITTEGYYRGMVRLAQAVATLGLKSEAYHSLSAHDQALVRMAAQEIRMAATLTAMLFVAGALKPAPDDDDKHLLYVGLNLLERVVSGTRGELMAFSNPLEVYQLTKNPAAGLGIVRDFGVFLKNLAEAPYYGLSGNADKMDYQTGSRKGQSKLWKSTKDLFPILRMDRIWEQLQTTGTNWVK